VKDLDFLKPSNDSTEKRYSPRREGMRVYDLPEIV
jgi:hypothetical protein